MSNRCNFPATVDHTVGELYWQVPGLGDICDECHRIWLDEFDECYAQLHPEAAGALSDPSLPRASRFQLPDHSCPNCGVALPLCKREGCGNMPRYDSGYCGVCDIVCNHGKGKRL